MPWRGIVGDGEWRIGNGEEYSNDVMKSYRELEVWKVSMDLVDAVYELTDRFPKSEVFNLTSQLRRAVVSVPSNIAEGWGRENTKDYIRFLLISKGSLMEIEVQLEIAVRQKFVAKEEIQKSWDLSQSSLKMLVKLIYSLRNPKN